MTLKFFNTLTKKKEIFKPIEKGKVKMYNCGPTVYNYPHIGNYRTYIFADLIKRVLKFKGFEVLQVMNITDVDDKTIRDSQKQNKPLKEFTEFYTKGFMQDLDKLNIAKQYDGFFGLQTNIKDPNPLEMISTYRGLWQVEQTFRIAKTNLEIRPIFHYTPSRIRAHLVICYMALALIRYVEFTLKYKNCHTPCDRLHELLGKMRKTRIIDQKDMAFEILENPSAELTAELMPIYKALKITWPKKLSNHPVL